MAAFSAGRYEAAVSAFEVSYKLKQSPRTLYQIGLTFGAMGQPAKALEAYKGFLSFGDAAQDQSAVATAQSEIARIERTAGRFGVKISPSAAVLEIDGHAAAIDQNREIWMMPGKHTVQIHAPGFDSYNQTIEVQSGRYSLEINLRPSTTAPSVQAAALVDEGMMLKVQHDPAGARDKFQDAEQLFSTPRGLAQLGLTEEMLGDLPSAEDHINQALAAKKDPWIRKNKPQLRKAQARILRGTRDYAKLQISGTPSGARLYIGDRQVGSLPVTTVLRVPAGHVLLVAKLEGFRDFAFDADLPRRSLRQVFVTLEAIPPAPPPPPPPPPPPAPPVESAPPPMAAAPEPPAKRPDNASQADIESLLRAQGKLPEDNPPATGFELNVDPGYEFWLGEGPFKSKGGPALRLSLGARYPSPVSFGFSLVDVSADFGRPGTNAIVTVAPGIYVRAHSQPRRKPHAVDFWGGAGFVPFAFAIAAYNSDATTAERLAASGSTTLASAATAEKAVTQKLGVDEVVTRQSLNIPIEVGATFFVTKGVGINLMASFTLWLPVQVCYHDNSDRYCISDGLKLEKSLFVGGGVYFLP
jgi:tetratricopeptide (TPR) repeat protein